MLATIISKYLQENRRLVIPQLGAFLVKEPGRVVLFSQLLTKDDGVLQNLLEQSGMSEVEASGAINRLLFDIRFVSENGGEYWLTGIGYFVKNEKGLLHFHFDAATTPQATYLTNKEQEAHEGAQEEKTQEPEKTQEQEVIQKRHEPQTSEEEPMEEATETPIPEISEEPTEKTESFLIETPSDEITQRPMPRRIRIVPPVIDTPKELTEEQGLEAAPEEYRHIHFEPDPDLEGLSYGGNSKRSRGKSSKKLDWWMIIAITSAVLALSVILYGFLREGAQHGSPIAARLEQSAK